MREKSFLRKIAGIFIDDIPVKLLALVMAVFVFVVISY